MKKIKSLVGAAALLASASAFATPVSLGGESPDLQTVINNLYLNAGTPVAQAPDVNADQLDEVGKFQIEASGISGSTMIIEVAGNAGSNTFGIYDVNNASNYIQLFAGGDTSGKKAFLTATDTNLFEVNYQGGGYASAQFTGSVFGYYLGTVNGPTFYSQAVRNGGNDQMVAFQGDGDMIKLPNNAAGKWGSSSFILAWEDLPLGSSDHDYQDMVVYVESVTPVPEPATTALLGLAGLGLALARRRKPAGSKPA